MASYTPVGIAGYTSGSIRPKTSIASNGVVSSSVGGFSISPTGQLTPAGISNPPPRPNNNPPEPVPPGTTQGSGSYLYPNYDPSKPGGVKKPGTATAATKTTPTWQDADYNAQAAAIQRALDLYKAQMGVANTRAGTQFAQSDRDMDQQKVRDHSDMENDFAARGVVNSGVYGTSVNDYDQEWNHQKETLSQQYKDALQDINMQYQSYLNSVTDQKEQARLDAVRRAAQAAELNPPKKTTSATAAVTAAAKAAAAKTSKSASQKAQEKLLNDMLNKLLK